METTAPVLVFCSWSRSTDDRRWFERVLTALQPLERQGVISLWHDGLVRPGCDLDQERARAFADASVVLLVFSPDYLASEQGYSELQQALRRYEAHEILLIPVLLSDCDWERALLGLDLQPLPADGRPLAGRRGRAERDQGLRQLASGLRQILSDRAAPLAAHSAQPTPVLWNVPFAPNPFFTGRQEELAALRASLQQRSAAAIGQAQAISGLGGVGKTRLAVEYAHRYRSAYRAVLWVNAASLDTLLASYGELATLLLLPARSKQEPSLVVLAVRRWLQTHTDYLLIFDNLDEPEVLFSPLPDWPPALGSPFLPPEVAGHLLITTRAADLGPLGLGLPHPLALPCFSPEQGALLLLRRARRLSPDAPLEQADPAERQEALLLSEELGGLPLALDQAGAYLAATGESLAAYRQLFQQRQLELLRLREGYRDPLGSDHPTPVATTWNLSCSRVRERHPEAVDLLHFCAFLAPDPIPEALLTAGLARLPHPLGKTVADRLALNAAIAALHAYSLLSRDPQSGSLQLHRLLQAVLRASLSPQEQRDWKQLVIKALVGAFPGEAVEHWPLREQLLPHALQAAAWVEAEPPLQTPGAAVLLAQTGSSLRRQGRYREALPLAERALSICEQTLGSDHPSTAPSLNNLALLYRHLGRWQDALPLAERALSIYEQTLGSHHPDTATSLNILALLYHDLGRWQDALPLYQRALSIREQTLGPDHPNTALSLNNLALLYRDLGRWQDALPLAERALSIREQTLGPDHPNTALSLHNLALLYHDLGRWQDALPLYQRALSIREQTLGPDHPDTALSLHNLAGLYHDLGRWQDALPLYQRALSICERSPGPDHPTTQTIRHNYERLRRQLQSEAD